MLTQAHLAVKYLQCGAAVTLTRAHLAVEYL